ncbi:AAA family ATPase [Sphingobacterium yanglingense]|uniref:Putative AbiEii toxin of type IV toxin-antitoxin system n=1 Tax=Sphingobacterium yanglingense TaxID=1437280 RepID=A0A4V3DE31_9SPHI|nr:AAA family ATPase [Sphingobacterium yanglingense]TDQ79079.1 putative AbiEii toxin of type IV toxin-antitoxin system [Sphingobacterium yanglingense]
MIDFKLIAVRPRKGCSSHILKALKTDQFYFFDSGYEPRTNNDWIKKKEANSNYVPEHFFYSGSSNTSLKSVNIQALVGKNGEGKSSLTELCLRIFNNYYKAKKVHEVTERLIFIEDLYAELYFLNDQKTYCISVSADNNKNVHAELFTLNQNGDIKEVIDLNIIDQLFFVINVNYSHYSLNSLDFIKESHQDNNRVKHSWIDKVFHRNDGYQTPMTLHPYRIKGNIDINTERELINQRLISLILTEPSYEFINKDLKVESFSFKKFDKTPIQNHLTNLTNNHELEESTHDKQMDQDKFNLDLLPEGLGAKYFVEQLNRFIDDWTPPEYRRSDWMDYVSVDDDNFKFINGTPIERIKTYLTWLDIQGKEEIINMWVMSQLAYDMVKQFDIKSKLHNSLFQYLCIKATKILRYPQYKAVNNFIKSKKYQDAIYIFIDNIEFENSHISLKFNQALHLLKLVIKSPDCKLSLFYSNFFENEKEKTNVELPELKSFIEEAIGLSDNKILKIYLNPPGIFKKSIILKDADKKETIKLGAISSGEYQKIGLLSSIIYHLTNLDSIQEVFHGDANTYKNVLLILDEIELYFHPDFQRTLLSDLLDRISKVNFRQLEAINLLFVTHSPFILSDIPKNNVMFLEKGKQSYPMSENTFGANIHTLLQHGFFLNSVPIGEFAKNKINELFDTLNQQTDLVPNLEKRILMVGEPFLKSQLLKKYHERIPSKNIDSLIKRITELESIIHDRNK